MATTPATDSEARPPSLPPPAMPAGAPAPPLNQDENKAPPASENPGSSSAACSFAGIARQTAIARRARYTPAAQDQTAIAKETPPATPPDAAAPRGTSRTPTASRPPRPGEQ